MKKGTKSAVAAAAGSVVSDPGRADNGIEGLELTSQASSQAGDNAYHPGTGQAHAASLLEPALPPLLGEGRASSRSRVLGLNSGWWTDNGSPRRLVRAAG